MLQVGEGQWREGGGVKFPFISVESVLNTGKYSLTRDFKCCGQ